MIIRQQIQKTLANNARFALKTVVVFIDNPEVARSAFVWSESRGKSGSREYVSH
ncbi:protein of unknown function [Pseudodesulfovibrio piezophilus C1TLV30]|uniref:Uncharacterized protein n=1 Tax=Pseudodesulfovibrio piezophilus (strain DSM 21447 / JCM 15486 / C1TLV30) TaxID=1322246 RepID=M1WK62_PSEP2|nr:protein of unknown function [Pseudodesulfovibrio piezophilus C1TLV30]